MIDFRTTLRTRLMQNVDQVLGPAALGSYIKLIDTRLHDVEKTQLPYLVVTVRRVRKNSPGEIGQPLSAQRDWLVHMYYLDMDADWATGDSRQTDIMSRLDKLLSKDPYLGQISQTDVEGNTEYVYTSEVTDILFDSTGVEGDYSFVSELYLTVTTDRR